MSTPAPAPTKRQRTLATGLIRHKDSVVVVVLPGPKFALPGVEVPTPDHNPLLMLKDLLAKGMNLVLTPEDLAARVKIHPVFTSVMEGVQTWKHIFEITVTEEEIAAAPQGSPFRLASLPELLAGDAEEFFDDHHLILDSCLG